MPLRLSKAVQLLHRPHLITETAASALASRLKELDPRAFDRPSRFGAVLRWAGIGEQAEPSRAEPRQVDLYCPHWLGEPSKRLDWGGSVKDGVALMQIAGPLLEHGGNVGECYEWFDGYDTIMASIAEADADPDVKAILIRFDTPGGVVASGIYDLSAALQARAADAKPIWAHCEMACSAGYWIASQCDRVLAPSAGVVGSIGVVMVHLNYGPALERIGVVTTSIEFPEDGLKTEGADWKALSEEMRAALQSDINEIGAAFLNTVHAGRGDKLTAEKARGLRAGVFPAAHSDPARDATSLGLIDAVMSEREAFEALRDQVAASPIQIRPAAIAPVRQPAARIPKESASQQETDMSLRKALAALKTEADPLKFRTQALAVLAEAEAAEAADGDEECDCAGEEGCECDKPAAETTDAPAAETPPAAATDPLARARAILALPEAKGREALAHELAFDAAMTVDRAKTLLGKSEKRSALGDKMKDVTLSADGGKPLTEEQARRAEAFAHAGVKRRER